MSKATLNVLETDPVEEKRLEEERKYQRQREEEERDLVEKKKLEEENQKAYMVCQQFLRKLEIAFPRLWTGRIIYGSFKNRQLK